MSGGIRVNFAEKDINFILQIQNFGNSNQTSQILYLETHFQIKFWVKNVSSEVKKKW